MIASGKQDLVILRSEEVSTEVLRLALLLLESLSGVLELTATVSIIEPVVSERILTVISMELELASLRVPTVHIPAAGS